MIERIQDDNSTLSISEASRAVIARLKDHNLLAIGKSDNDTNTKDIYLLAVALGLSSPIETSNKGAESYTRTIYFKSDDKALLTAALLDTIKDTTEITDFCDSKKAFAYSKGFTNAGFQEIDRIAADGLYDPELVVQKLLDYVDAAFDETVAQT